MVNLRIAGELEELVLWNTRITDRGLEQLELLTALKVLAGEGTCITDAGLDHLTKLKRLEHLDLDFTSVTDSGISKLDQKQASFFIESLFFEKKLENLCMFME